MKRCIITIAVGKPYYLKLAENLLASFLLNNKINDLHFLLVTDNVNFYNKYNNISKVTIKPISLDDSEISFTSKFKLFEHAVAEENLFIDCDCLVYKDLTDVFDAFKGKSFSAIGNNIFSGDFFCNVKDIITKFKLDSMPKFVGSIYYFKMDEKARDVFETATGLKSRYDEFGFVRLRDKENEEPLFAVAMGLTNETLIPNDGNIKADLMYYQKIHSDVLKGETQVSKPISKITGGEDIPDEASPAILHFNGSFSDSIDYKLELFRLKHNRSNKFLINSLGFVGFILPHVLKNNFKNLLRPLFRSLYGYRKLKGTSRIL